MGTKLWAKNPVRFSPTGLTWHFPTAVTPTASVTLKSFLTLRVLGIFGLFSPTCHCPILVAILKTFSIVSLEEQMNRYATHDFDNRDSAQMYEYLEARIEVMKRRIAEQIPEEGTYAPAEVDASRACKRAAFPDHRSGDVQRGFVPLAPIEERARLSSEARAASRDSRQLHNRLHPPIHHLIA